MANGEDDPAKEAQDMDLSLDPGAGPEFPFSVGRKLTRVTREKELQRRAAKGDAKAANDLALTFWDRAHAKGGWPDGELLQESIRLFRAAADAQLPEGMFALGYVEMTVVGMKSVRDAIHWFKDGAALGHHESRKALEWIEANFREVVVTVRR